MNSCDNDIQCILGHQFKFSIGDAYSVSADNSLIQQDDFNDSIRQSLLNVATIQFNPVAKVCSTDTESIEKVYFEIMA